MKKSRAIGSTRLQTPKLMTCPAQVTLSEVTRQVRYEPYRVTNQSRAIGTKLMRSTKWAPPAESKVRLRGLPYIMKSGKLSGSVKLTWKCSAYQWIATVVRSVIERLKKRTVVKRRNKYKTERNLTEIAIYYVLTNDEHILERLLHCNRRHFRSMFYSLYKRLDEPMRFCFDQALSSALWFELRGYPRAQSNKDYVVETVYEPMVHGRARQILTYANALCDPWIVKSNKAFTKGMCFLSPKWV
jgi:hypothetical protein